MEKLRVIAFIRQQRSKVTYYISRLVGKLVQRFVRIPDISAFHSFHIAKNHIGFLEFVKILWRILYRSVVD